MKFWIKLKKYRNVVSGYYIGYSIVFCVLALAVFSGFYLNGKSFIWKLDGIYQHFNSLAYYGTYLRSVISNLIHNGVLEIPLFDFTIGYGSDILTTLHYYVVGDPLALLAVFFSPENTEKLYCFLIVLRFYMAGISFSCYSLYMRKGKYQTLMGTLVYTFCGFALFAGLRHPYFLNPMIYFPFLLMGIEKILKKEKPYLFIGMVFLSAVSNFYFFYMITILAVTYTIIRFFGIYKKERVKAFLDNIKKFVLYYIVGLLMSCIIFFPVVWAVLNSARSGTDSSVNIFYELSYYLKIPISFIIIRTSGYWTYMGYGFIALLSVFVIMYNWKKHLQLTMAFLILGLWLCLPFAGHVLHGFSYTSNRWIWGFSFLIGFMVVTAIPRLLDLNKNSFIFVTVLLCFYTAICVFYCMDYGIHVTYVMFPVMLWQCIGFNWLLKRWDKQTRGWDIAVKTVLLLIVCMNIMWNSVEYFTEYGENYAAEFYDSDSAMEILRYNKNSVINEIDDDSFYRYEDTRNGTKFYNSAMQLGTHGVNFYFSLSNPNAFDYFIDVQLNISRDYDYNDLNGRAVLLALANSKYYVASENELGYLPYGYEKSAASTFDYKDQLYYAYENSYALPFGYTYRNTISSQEYEDMSAIEKQQAMLQGVLINSDYESSLKMLDNSELTFSDKVLPYEVTEVSGMEVTDESFIVKEKNATMTLTFNGTANSETYIVFSDIYFKSNNGSTGSKITASSGSVKRSYTLNNPDYSWYMGLHNYSLMVSYSEDGLNEVTLQFEKKGIYEFGDLQVVCQPMDDYDQQVEALAEDALENTVFTTNQVSGTISLDETKFLCLSIPYSSGWIAYVDGEKADLLQANTMFMGLELEPGEHEIILKYTTPGLPLGIVLSIVGCTGLIGIIIYNKKSKKHLYPSKQSVKSVEDNI